MILHLLYGPVGAGKTLFAERLAGEGRALRLSPDEWMRALYGPDPPAERFAEYLERVVALVWAEVARLAALDVDVILDFGFWTRRSRDDARERGRALGARVILYELRASPGERRRRVLARTAAAGSGSLFIDEAAIARLDGRLEPLAADEERIVVETESATGTSLPATVPPAGLESPAAAAAGGPVLSTERLRLRQFRADDLDDYAALCADPEVMRHLSAGGETLSREDAWRQMAMFSGHWQLRGYGMWVAEERLSGRFVGRIGLHFPEGFPDRELGWALARPFWGRGLATEAARAAARHARSLGWDHLVSYILPANERSIRVAERLGALSAGTVVLRGIEHRIYRLDLAR